MIEGRDELLLKRHRESQVQSPSVLVELGCVTPPVSECVHQPGSSLNPRYWWFDGCFVP